MDEHAENLIADAIQVTQSLGFLSLDAFNNFKNNVVRGMLEFGSKFFIALGTALKEAIVSEAIKIMTVWRSKCEEYAILCEISDAKKLACES